MKTEPQNTSTDASGLYIRCFTAAEPVKSYMLTITYREKAETYSVWICVSGLPK